MVGFDAYAKIILQVVLEERIRSFLLQHYPLGHIELYNNYKSPKQFSSLVVKWFDGIILPGPKQQLKLGKKLKKHLEDKTLAAQLGVHKTSVSEHTLTAAFAKDGTESEDATRDAARTQIIALIQHAVDIRKTEKESYDQTVGVWDKFWGGFPAAQTVKTVSHGGHKFTMNVPNIPAQKAIAAGDNFDKVTNIKGEEILVHFFKRSQAFWKATHEWGEWGDTGTNAIYQQLIPKIPKLSGLLTYLPVGNSILGKQHGVGKEGSDPEFKNDPNWALKRCATTWLFWYLPVKYIPNTDTYGDNLWPYNWSQAQEKAGWDIPSDDRTMRDLVLKALTGDNRKEARKRIDWWRTKCSATPAHYKNKAEEEKIKWSNHNDWLQLLGPLFDKVIDIGGFIDYLGSEQTDHQSKIQKLYFFAALALDDSAESKKKWEEIKENLICQNEIKEKKEREKEELEKTGDKEAIKAKQDEIDQIQDAIDALEGDSGEMGYTALQKIFEKFILKTVVDITNYVKENGKTGEMDQLGAHKAGTTVAKFIKGDIVDLLKDDDATKAAASSAVAELRNYNQILESMIFNVIDLIEV
jgi:hypothetical protein